MKFAQSDNIFTLQDPVQYIPQLNAGVYLLKYSDRLGLYLDRSCDQFVLPTKLYDVEHDFINRVIKTNSALSTGSLGIILNGIKGTGKTVTAKIIANQLDLPIILVNDKYDSLPSFISKLPQRCIIFIDEYEKIYRDYKDDLLSVMDGALSNLQHIFIFTTNSLTISENLMQRPSRIRYVKTYSDLPLNTINLILDDKLVYTEHRQSIIDLLSILSDITIDLVCSIIEEVNIHNEPAHAFKDIFNLKEVNNTYDLIQIGKDGSMVCVGQKELNYNISKKSVNQRFSYGQHNNELSLKQYLGDDTFICNSISYDADTEEYVDSTITVKFIEKPKYHYQFAKMS